MKTQGRIVIEPLQSRRMLSADDIGLGAPDAGDFAGDPTEVEILVPGEEEEWYTLELPIEEGGELVEGEIIEEEFELEILVIDEGGDVEVPPEDGEVVADGEVVDDGIIVIDDEEIYYTMAPVDGEEEGPVVGEGVEGEVIITMAPEENIWLKLECSAPADSAAVQAGDTDSRGLPLAPGDDGELAGPGIGDRWAAPIEAEGDAMPGDVTYPDDTLGEEEPVDNAGDDAGDGLAIIAADQMPDGSAFGGDVVIDEDTIFGEDQEILA